MNREFARGCVVIAIVFIALVWPPILLGGGESSELHDQANYHLPVIRTFAAQWPAVDLIHYQSATAPGYHLFMALIVRYITNHDVVLQLLSSLFGLGLLLAMYVRIVPHVGASIGILMMSPLMFASLVLSGSIWLTTDNAAWMFIALALGGAAMLEATPGRASRWGLYATLAAFIRQIHVWVAAPVCVATLFGMLWMKQPTRWVGAVIITVVPIMLVTWLIWIWGGLMPPAYVDLHNHGANPAFFPMLLSLFGMFGIFFVPVFTKQWREALRSKAVWIAAAIGFIIALLVPTSFSIDEGRWGGAIWVAVNRLPAIGDRTILFPPLAAIGAAILMLMWRAAVANQHTRGALLLMLGLLCWAAAQSLNSQAWQRYSEPFVIMTLIWFAALARSHDHSIMTDKPGDITTATWVRGPLLLGIIQLLLTIISLYLPMLGRSWGGIH